MFCPKCGSQVEDGLSFCPNCGTPLSRPATTPPQPAQQQPPAQQQAQQPIQQQAPQPQRTVQPQQPYPQQAPQPQPGKARKPPVVVVVIAAVAALAAVAAVVAFVVLPRVMPRGIWVATKSSEITKDADGTQTNISTHTIDDRGNTILRHVDCTTAKGTKITTEDNINFDDRGFATSGDYTYNSELQGTTESTPTYKSTSAYQWTLGDGDKPTKLVLTTTDDSGTGTYTQDYAYGSDGHISKLMTTDIGTNYQSEAVMEIDSHGLYTKATYKSTSKDSKTQKTVQENTDTVWKYEFDQSNRPTHYTTTITDTSTNAKVKETAHTLEYDQNGNLARENVETTTYENGTPQKSTSEITYEYKYVDNPTPWVAEVVRESPYAFSGPTLS